MRNDFAYHGTDDAIPRVCRGFAVLDSLPRSRALVLLDQNGFLMPVEPVTPPNSSVWKVVHFPVALLVVAVGLLVIGVVATQLVAMVVRNAGHIGTVALLIAPIVGALVVVTVYAVFVRLVERRREFVEFELADWLQELGASYGIGLLLYSLVFGSIVALGGFTVVGFNLSLALVVPFVTSICTAVIEEIVLRGLFFRLIERLLGSWIALAISVVVFSVVNLVQPQATLLSCIGTVMRDGVMLAAMYMVTRRLWAAIGLHAAWYFAQGGIYGLTISGFERSLMQTIITGPELMTGGTFGPVASLPAILIDTLFAVALLIVAVRRGKIVAPAWTRGKKRRQRGDEQS